jgi:hypothetical protein
MVVKMIKVGIVTIHMAYNYGAVLQAYALKHTIRKLGNICEIIDYRVESIYGCYYPFADFYLSGLNLFSITGLRYIKYNLLSKIRWDKTAKFEHFIKKELSKNRIHNLKELKDIDYDIVVYGSDQIWNRSITGGEFEPFYFGKEIPHEVKKISYAASCGNANEDLKDDSYFLELVDEFDSISVREYELKDYLVSAGKKAEVVLDPTLLLDKNEWIDFIKKTNRRSEKYLLIYTIYDSPSIRQRAKKIAKENGLKIYEIDPNGETCADKVFNNLSPYEFVEVFSNAMYVLTNTFHGTCFSVIMNKEFEVYLDKHKRNNSRIVNFLTTIDLGNRISFSENGNEIKMKEKIDYMRVNLQLTSLRKKSIEYLEHNIGVK